MLLQKSSERYIYLIVRERCLIVTEDLKTVVEDNLKPEVIFYMYFLSCCYCQLSCCHV